MKDLRDTAEAETNGIQQPHRTEGCELDKALIEHFSETLALPAEATQFLMDVWSCIQLFDDVADGDTVERADLDKVIWITLVGMHANPFFEAKKAALLPVLSTMILKWQASDKAERAGQADAKSYVWRAGYYDLILLTVQLCHGVEVATAFSHVVMQMYGETLGEYLKEFGNA